MGWLDTIVKTRQRQAPVRPVEPAGQALVDLIGHTPLVRLERIARLPERVALYGKAEWFNPGGSVKDRPALTIVRAAETRGVLGPGRTLIDSTSGNMGIAYAMLGAARGFGVKLVVPANLSAARQAILHHYGAELVYSDPLEGSDGAIRMVREIVAAEPDRYFFANQYDNPENWRAHYNTTALEIWEQTGGQITHFVAGLGTSGTFVGVTRRLRELAAWRGTPLTAVSMQPDASFHGLEGLKHMPTAILPGIYDANLADRNITVTTEEAHAMARRLAREEGLLAGVSAAAAVAGALEIARGLEAGVVVTVLPDGGMKYLEEPFWKQS